MGGPRRAVPDRIVTSILSFTVRQHGGKHALAHIAAWESGERKGVLIAEKFKIDVTLSPMPRYDLIKFDHYLPIGVQYSRVPAFDITRNCSEETAGVGFGVGPEGCAKDETDGPPWTQR
jgi:hypothetical protein